MNRDALLAIIAEWLEETREPQLVPRDHPAIDLENLKRVLAVVGPRRAGKTFFMFQMVACLLKTGRHTRRDILFIDFEDYRLSGFSTDDMEVLFSAFHQLAGRDPLFLFFDEVQRLPDWGRVLRTLHNRRRFRIIVSGSNSRLLHPEVATELRGRYEHLLMLPFSFAEYVRCRNLEVRPTLLHTSRRGKLMAAFEDYLRHGGFPEVVLAESEPERRRLLQDYLRTVFYKDLLERHNIKARLTLDAMLKEMLEMYSETFSISRFETQLKTGGLPASKRTVANYLEFLREAFFIIVNEKFSFSDRRRTMNPKKVYLMDPGFAMIGHPHSENLGKLLENIVAVELFRRGEDAFYFKDRNECDFILREGQHPTQALQVCWELNSRNEQRETAGLVEAIRKLKLASGAILTRDQEGSRALDGMEIPVRSVWRWLLEEGVPPAGDLPGQET